MVNLYKLLNVLEQGMSLFQLNKWKTEGFCEEMNVVYRTEELNTHLRYPKQEINPWHKHSTYIRLKLREILKVNLTDITIIDIISLP